VGIIKCMNTACRFFDREKLDNCAHAFMQIKLCKDSLINHVEIKKYQNSYLSALYSNECVCGNTKKTKKSFCYSCYKKLPRDLQTDLYSRMGAGYEQAYDAAVKYLDEL